MVRGSVRGWLLLVLVLSAGAAACASVAPASPLAGEGFDFSAVDWALEDAVASGELPGAVVLVGRGERVLHQRAVGLRATVPRPSPMDVATVFDVASLTKPLATTLAVLSLAERGTLDLDAPLGRVLPEFRGPEFAAVTIRRMLTHTAGFAAIPPDAALAGGFPRAAAGLAKIRLDYPPGGGFQYSDVGFILLGEVVRRASGQPLDRYVERAFYQPLGLRDTSFHPPAEARARIAPTEFANGRLLTGEVHDPRARLLGGVAGHSGLFSTAADLARLIRMLLADGALDGRRYFRPETVRAMWTPSGEAGSGRALGWDVTSRYAAAFAPFFPIGSVGHTGFTGTSAWLDPASGAYVILLTNRVHPTGGGSARIRDLRERVTAAVGATLFAGDPPPMEFPAGATAADTPLARLATPVSSSSPAREASAAREAFAAREPYAAREPSAVRVRSGLDVLAGQDFARLRGESVAVVTNQTGVDAAGRRLVDLLSAAPGVKLQAIFSPEHGLAGDANSKVPHGRDPATGKPVWSLYGPTLKPTAAMLKDVSVIVFDIQDVGVRYYTYLTTLVYVMEAAAARGIPVVVLDRPNPITGLVVEGPLMDPDLQSFTAPHPLPVRTGMTIGEFARMAANERRIPVNLDVIAMQGWERGLWYDETGLPWVNPSPNIRSVTQALLYSGVGLLEATNLSVGRGTDTPFEVVGAPWIEAGGLAEALAQQRLAGVRFEPAWFTPTGDKYARTPCAGIRLIVTDREAVRPYAVGLAVAKALRLRHRDQFKPEAIQNLLVNRSTMWGFLRGDPLERLLAWASSDRVSFLKRRASYLIYR